jgi:hypothetical protein
VTLSALLAPLIVGAASRSNWRAERRLDSPAAQDTVGCLDTLHASDSVTAVIKMTVRPQDRGTKLPADFEGLFIQEFKSRLKVPPKLALSVMKGWTPCDSVSQKCVAGILIFGSQAYATAHRNGTLSRIGVIDITLTPAFSETVGTILTRMGEEKLVPSFDKADSIPLDLAILLEQRPDTVPAFRQLFRATIPRFESQFSYGEYPKDAGGPKYPYRAGLARVGDTVSVAFTILADGTIEPQSVDVLKGHYRDFIRAVFDKLATTRYVPARIGACAVASRAAQTFVFKEP